MTPFTLRLRRTTLLCAALALAVVPLAAPAQTYSVQINPTLNNLNIKIEPVVNPGLLVVNLTNKGDKKVRCDLKFDPSPQMPYRTTKFLDPGEKEASVLRATQTWFSVAVDVTCQPVQK